MLIETAQIDEVITLGRVGENEARAIRFPIREILLEFPNAEINLLHKRPVDEAPYPVVITRSGDYVLWVIHSSDVFQRGEGHCELIAMEDGAIVKEDIYTTYTDKSLDGNTSTPPPAWQGWVDSVLEAGSTASSAAERAEAAASLLEHPGAEATTLETGEPATASYMNGVFYFGLPRGATGKSAYAYAVSKGYSGTEEQFAELMASHASVAQQAIAAKDAAVIAQGLAESAQTAAERAQGMAESARDEARRCVNEAAEEANRAEQAATNAGYMFFEIIDGHLMYERTDQVTADFEIDNDGHLVLV